MERINYQHLYYFWMIARERSVTRASEKLHLAQPTISAQLAALENAVGAMLFHRDGKRLTLTETGQLVFHYAEEIFTLGRELTQALNGWSEGRNLRLYVGLADTFPRLMAYRLIEPVLRAPKPVQLICHEDKAERLLTHVGANGLDLVLTDVPATPASSQAFNHLLGESPVAVFGTAVLAEVYRRDFPRSLSGAPFLLPTTNTPLRRSLDQWFDAENIAPQIRGEIEDSALLKTFARGGVGLFVAPMLAETELRHQYQVELVGPIDTVQERYYAVTPRARLNHPVVTTILESARAGFG